MLPAPFTNALVLTGPTGAGKTQLALDLAERLDAEIISMDSMALYRGMDIGTAKPTPEERQRVRHHLVDVLEPWESASVAWWLTQAEACCRDIEARGKQVLFAGGTPLYLKALLCGLFDGPPADAALRRRLEEEAAEHGTAALHRRLADVDPVGAARIHPNDLRRIVRALEVHTLTGRPISAWQTQWKQGSGARGQGSGKKGQSAGDAGQGAAAQETDSLAPDPWPLTPPSLTPVLWLDLPRAELYARIDRRVEAMFGAGLVEEVRRLRALDRPLSREAAQALGYKEVFALLEGRATMQETVVQVQTRSRNFAKRQITWFRHLPGCRPATKELTWDRWQSKMRTSDALAAGDRRTP